MMKKKFFLFVPLMLLGELSLIDAQANGVAYYESPIPRFANYYYKGAPAYRASVGFYWKGYQYNSAYYYVPQYDICIAFVNGKYRPVRPIVKYRRRNYYPRPECPPPISPSLRPVVPLTPHRPKRVVPK